jgi:signal transduction histidine kinase
MDKITLNQWFFKNTRLPLFLLGLVVAMVQVGFIFYTHSQSKEGQKRAIKSLVATIANIGIEQGNRPLLESSFQLAIDELGVKSIVVCDEERKLFHQPMGFGRCPQPPQARLFESVISISPSGFKNISLYFYVSKYHVGPSLIWLNIIILGLLGLVFHLIYRIQTKLSQDILTPLEKNLSGDDESKIKELNHIKERFEEYRQSKEKQAIAGAILEHNLSIGHNIKSLQQTLDAILSGEFSSKRQKKRVEQLSKDIKAVMAKIADQTPNTDKVKLITSDETFFDYLEKENEKKTKVNVVNVFEIAIEQKNIEMKNSKKRPQINFSYQQELKKSFIEVVGPELRDILSNMMNNSIEAGASQIDIELLKTDNELVINFTDNGQGIPSPIQNNIFDRGFTKGKEHGTGYGLYHGQKFIESWGGRFCLTKSVTGKTRFSVKLPIWQEPSLGLDGAKVLVVLDDEEQIHCAWKSKVSLLNPEAQVFTFRSQESFLQWFEACDDFKNHIFVFDSDLGPGNERGERLIESLGIETQSHVVTNNYNNPLLAKWCSDRGISLIPKMMYI